MSNILDLDAIAPEPQLVTFTDKEGIKHTWDIGRPPYKVALLTISHMDELFKGEEAGNDLLDEIIVLTLQVTEPGITRQWLTDNIPEFGQRFALLNSITTLVQDRLKTAGLVVGEEDAASE